MSQTLERGAVGSRERAREPGRKHRWRQTHTNSNLRKSLFWEISQTKRVSQPRRERTFARRTEMYIVPMTLGGCKWQYNHLFALRPFELRNSFQYYSWQKFLTALQMLLTKLKASTIHARWSKSRRVRIEHSVLAEKQVSLQTESEFVFHHSLRNTWTNHAADGPSIVVLFFVQLINEKWNFNYFPRRCHSLYWNSVRGNLPRVSWAANDILHQLAKPTSSPLKPPIYTSTCILANEALTWFRFPLWGQLR